MQRKSKQARWSAHSPSLKHSPRLGSAKLIETTAHPCLSYFIVAFYGTSPAGYESITLEPARTGADRAGRPAPVLSGPAYRPRPARVGRAQRPGPRPSRPVQPINNELQCYWQAHSPDPGPGRRPAPRGVAADPAGSRLPSGAGRAGALGLVLHAAAVGGGTAHKTADKLCCE